MEKTKSDVAPAAARLVSYLYIGQAIGILITVITFVFVTRHLGASNYGIYTLAFGFSALIDAVGNFGINSYFGRNLAKYTYAKDHKNVIKTLFSGYTIIIPLALFLSLLGIALSPYAAGLENVSATTFMLASGILFFSIVEYVSVQALIGFGRGKLASVVSVFVDIVQLASIVILLYSGYGVNGAIAGMLIGYVLGCALSLALVYNVVSKQGPVDAGALTKEDVKSAWNYVFPLGLNNILNFSVQSFGTLYLGYILIKSNPASAKAIVGTYGAALGGLNFLAIFYNTMSSALVPIFTTASMSKDPKTVNRTYNKMLLYSLLFTLPFMVYVGVFAGPGVNLLLRSQYSSTGLYLSLIAFGTVLNTFQFYLASLIVSKGFTRKLLKYSLVSTALQYAAILILTPLYGVIGLIVGLFFIGSILDDVFLIALSKKYLNLKFEYKKLSLLFISNILLALPLSLALFLGNSIIVLVAGLLILCIAYPPIIVLLNVIERTDLDLMKNLSKKMPWLSKPTNVLTAYLNFLFGIRGTAKG